MDGENFLISSSTSEPIVEACKKTKEFTIEAWITPALESQGGPARIVTLTRGSSAHAILIAQGAFQIAPTTGFIARTPTDAADGTRRPPLSTRSSPAELTHIVFCHAKDGSRILYVNGEAVDQDHLPGDFSNWPIEFPLSIGGDLEGPNQGGHSRAWKGVIHFAALFDSALTEGEVRQNYKAGPGH